MMEYINAIIGSILELHWGKIQSAIDWANVFAGAIVSLIFVYFPLIIKFTFMLFKDKYKGYYGRYYLYGYYLIQDVKNGKQINTVTINIKKSYFGGDPKVKWDDGKYKYEGYMKIYDYNIYLHVVGTTHKEEQLFITRNTLLPEQFRIKLGLKVAINNNGDPAFSYNILSRKELTHEQAQGILGANKNVTLTKDDCFKKIPDVIDPKTSRSKAA